MSLMKKIALLKYIKISEQGKTTNDGLLVFLWVKDGQESGKIKEKMKR